MPANLTDALARDDSTGRRFLVPYLMVDRQRLKRFDRLISAARSAGASAVELGFPFTDPIADGPTLQAASVRALRHGTRWSDLLDAVRIATRHLPCAVMTYANPVFHRRLEEAISTLHDAGATGLIVPDLALEEAGPWTRAAEASDVALVLMAAPGASSNRIETLVRRSAGFLYLVSRYGVTGGTGIRGTAELRTIIATSHRLRRRLPVLIGFGVRAPADVRRVLRTGADGFVVGSALEERLSKDLSDRSVTAFLQPLANAMVTLREPAQTPTDRA